MDLRPPSRRGYDGRNGPPPRRARLRHPARSCRHGPPTREAEVGGENVHVRSFGLTLVAGTALLLSACTSTGGSPAASVAPDPCAGAKAGAAHTPPTDWTKAKIGVVTDIGTL